VASVLGYTPRELLELGPDMLSTVIHPDDAGRVDDLLARLGAAHDDEVIDYELRVKDSQESWRSLQFHDVVFSRAADGSVAQVLGVVEDVTDRRQGEERLREQAALLDLTHEAIFVQDMSYRVRYWNRGSEKLYSWPAGEAVGQDVTHLLSVGNRDDLTAARSAVLQDGVWTGILQQRTRDGRDLVVQSSWTLLQDEGRPPRSILTFARGAEGERVPLQPAHLVREMQKIAEETFPKSISVGADLADGLWVVSGQATLLQQVLMNLCVNARDAMPQGGTLSLTAQNVTLDERAARSNPKAHPGPYVLLTVADTGAGIAPEVMDRMFDPFFTTKGLGHGTGLGLSTTLSIVESHGGFVDVYSEVGRGTAFHVYLPALPAEPKSGLPSARRRSRQERASWYCWWTTSRPSWRSRERRRRTTATGSSRRPTDGPPWPLTSATPAG
jgi:PAS domain S-box-containing protein